MISFRYSLAGTLALLVATPGATVSQEPVACRISADRADTLRLADGGLVYANAAGMLAREGQTVIAGNPVFPWPLADTAIQDSLLGLAVGRNGEASLIRAPHAGKRAMHPRLLVGREGMDVLFAEHGEGVPVHSTALVTGSLWAGTYAGGWSNLRRLAVLSAGRLAPHESSRWFRRDDQTAFYFGFDRTAGDPVLTRAGMVRLWELGAERHADTLFLPHEFFGLSADTASGYDVIAFLQPDTNAYGRPANSRVWVTEWSNGFRPPRQLTFAGPPPTRISVRVMSWDAAMFGWQTLDGNTFVLRARRGPDGYTTLGIDTLGRASGYFVHATRSGSVLLFRAEPTQRRLHVHRVTRSRTEYLGHVPSGDAILIPAILALSDREFVHLAHSFATDGGNALVVSQVTHVHVLCA
ncbi:MAG: hypothetical protein JNJ98_16905 [Gemmatimonadetes bacterium]|nr:hypothetical protein [Gemmatimonadota bacterium]